MKSVLTVFAFAISFVFTSCNNDNTTDNNKNNPDSIAATDSPTSTAVLMDDSANLKNVDTANMSH